MKNISTEDYILWNTKTNSPVESLDIVYHHTSVVEMINDGFTLGENEIFVQVIWLDLETQKKISEAIDLAEFPGK